MQSWDFIAAIVAVLSAALLFGVVAARLRQDPIIGYLFAGIVIGPSVLDILKSGAALRDLSELGVALLLFTVGLEFSLNDLRRLGVVAWLGGILQVSATVAVTWLLLLAAGLNSTESLLIGMAVSMSSTAVVIRVLASRTELDSHHGRNALGILLMQDLAVVPLLFVTEAISRKGGGHETLSGLTLAALSGLALVAIIFFMARVVLPKLMLHASPSANRDLSVILAVTSCLGAAWGAHAAGLSPALGAFAAGLLLSGSPFAGQIRADITPLSASFITMFFASIGTLVEIRGWSELGAALIAAFGLMSVKASILAAIVWSFQRSAAVAMATALALCQVGEFTFVLADVGSRGGLIDPSSFRTLLAASVTSLLVTPYLIAAAPRLIRRAGRTSGKGKRDEMEGRVIVIGYGPAGEDVARRLVAAGMPFLVIDQNPRRAVSHPPDLPIVFGDATQSEILLHAGAASAAAIVCTIPDPKTARLIIGQVRRLAPSAPVVARARYHLYARDLEQAGARVVIDEEYLVGNRLGESVLELIALNEPGHAHNASG